MGVRIKAASTLTVILLIALGLEIVPVLTVPVAKGLWLAEYDNVRFGVFGYCSSTDDATCSAISVGYASAGLSFPSNARSSLANLLIVHVVSCGLTFIMALLALIAHFHGPGSSPGYLMALLIWCIPTFLVTLLAFLVDILLFVNHLRWPGWIVLGSTGLIIFAGMMLCLMRRTLSSQNAMRNHLNNDDDAALFGPDPFNPMPASRPVPEFTELKYEPSTTATKVLTSDTRSTALPEDERPLTGPQVYANDADFSFNSLNNASMASVNDYSKYTRDYNGGTAAPKRAPSPGFNTDDYADLPTQQPQQPQQPGSQYKRPQKTQRQMAPIPAGTMLGDDASDRMSYGPGVIPLPSIRDSRLPSARHVEPLHQYPEPQSATPYQGDADVYGQSYGASNNQYGQYGQATTADRPLPLPKNRSPQHSNAASQDNQYYRKPSGPRAAPQNFSAPIALTDMVDSPTIGASSTPAPQAAAAGGNGAYETVSPPSHSRGNSRQELRAHYMGTSPQHQQPAQDDDYFRAPVSSSDPYRPFTASPAVSESSHYTSISQQPGYGPQQPVQAQGQFNYAQQPNQYSYGPAAAPAAASRKPNRSEMALDANPDFQLGAPRKRGANKPKIGAASSSNDAYGISRY